MPMRFLVFSMMLLIASPALANDAEFFEKKIRPVLVEHCFKCHSNQAAKIKGKLLLDSGAGIRKGGASGPSLVAGNADASLLIKALRYDGALQMPPAGKLPKAVIADFEKWVGLGAVLPKDDAADVVKKPSNMSEVARKHWAFQPIRKPALPAVKRTDWVRNGIDAFVLAKLESAGLPPAPPASAAMLTRRLYFDLIGLPPTPEELQDGSPMEKTIDRLLASPHYGERWGRHWLDVVRYADSAGYELDTFYDFAWQYRDYVIRSLNDNKPMDRFLQEQLAGDELWPDSEEARIATGFCTVGPYAYEGGIGRPKVIEYQRLTDIADTTGSALLGLTVGCARCHDHKYDPISQHDYFALQAIFAASEFKDEKIGPSRAKSTLAARVLQNRPEAPKTHLLRRGELETPGEEVAPALIRLLSENVRDQPGRDVKGRRAALARWLTAPENPLTARVLANRVWQWHFGKALVRTPNDFGVQGELPTHPELLDYLAAELVSHGWDLKHLHRLILNSNTYRMSSGGVEQSAQRDPDHRLLSRFPRRRLEAEAVWDGLHAVAGTLNRKPYGPAVVPPVDPDALKSLLNTNWKVTADKTEWTRRGVYIAVRRSLQFPLFDTFNGAKGLESCAGRENTVVAGQALMLLNSEAVRSQAKALAERLRRECPKDEAERVRRGWLLVFSRPATASEVERTLAFLRGREGDALTLWCLALLNANEFLYID
jgi:hypothetical protein